LASHFSILVGEKVVRIKVSFIAAAISLGASCASADPLQPSLDHALPPAKANAIVQSMGLVPIEQPVRKGLTYVVIANNRQGRSVRIIVDARFGKVLAVQRVIAVIPPGTYPVRPPVDTAPTQPHAPNQAGAPAVRPPAVVARPLAPPPAKPDQKPTITPANPTPSVIGTSSSVTAPKPPGSGSDPIPAVVTTGTLSAKPVADPKPTGNVSGPSFPPMQSLE
jgi:hypothetical protein